MALVARPTPFRTKGARFWRVVPRSAPASPFTGEDQVLVHSAGFWMCELPMAPHRIDEADAIDAFLDLLRDETNTVAFSGGDFKRVSAVPTTFWTLTRQSPSSLNRADDGTGRSIRTILQFKELVQS